MKPKDWYKKHDPFHPMRCSPNNGCTYKIINHTLFICEQSGYYHECGSKCQRRSVHEDGMICPISNRFHQKAIAVNQLALSSLISDDYMMDNESFSIEKAKEKGSSRNYKTKKRKRVLLNEFDKDKFDIDADPNDFHYKSSINTKNISATIKKTVKKILNNHFISGDVKLEVVKRVKSYAAKHNITNKKILVKQAKLERSLMITQSDINAYSNEILKFYEFVCTYIKRVIPIDAFTISFLQICLSNINYKGVTIIPKDELLIKILPNSARLQRIVGHNKKKNIMASKEYIIKAYDEYHKIRKPNQPMYPVKFDNIKKVKEENFKKDKIKSKTLVKLGN